MSEIPLASYTSAPTVGATGEAALMLGQWWDTATESSMIPVIMCVKHGLALAALATSLFATHIATVGSKEAAMADHC